MGTGRTLRKKPRTRPRKNTGDRRHREKAQRTRLVKLGLDATVVAKMQPDKVRELLKLPAKIKKS